MIGGTTGRDRLRGMCVLAVAGIALLVAGCGSSSSPSSASGGLPSLQTLTAQALSYAKCMRAHGIPNFPDPVENGQNIGFSGNVRTDHNSPRFKAAQSACQSLLPGGGP